MHEQDYVVGVYLLQSTNEFDIEYSYLVNIESDYAHKIKRGSFVTVPFGRANKPVRALVWSIDGKYPQTTRSKLKYVSELCENIPALDDRQLDVARQIHEHFFCTVGDAIKCFISKDGYKARTVTKLSLAISHEEAIEVINSNKLRNIKQIEALRLLMDTPAGLENKEIINILGLNSDSTVKTLVKRGYIRTEKTEESPVKRNLPSHKGMNTYSAHKLNAEQQKAYDFILRLINAGKFSECLLHGVTGSGKTEVYMQIIAYIMEKGGSSLVLVPEIALTPQMIANFTARFGDTVAVLHSRLTDAQRGDQWQRIRNKEARIVIGTRSAVFAPIDDLKIIIIDEEHDGSYCSEEANPHYTAAEVAQMRAKQTNAVILYGSATPSVKTFYRAVNHEIYYMSLKMRANERPLPQCYILDMRQKRMAGSENTIICSDVRNEIIKNFSQGLQTMVFVHRRGYSGQVICKGCGKTMKCKKCSVPMTYHAQSNRLICHYCGNTVVKPEICPQCGSEQFENKSVGTQMICNELQEMIPQARILRMDADTTATKDGHSAILTKFASGQADILVGTQMIAKGHDFPKVTLVCILNADSVMNMEDYMASERAYQLFTQVAGRSGRAQAAGKVLIQAYDVDAYPLTAGANADYMEFYKNEIAVRKGLDFPPFCSMCTLRFSGLDDKKVYMHAKAQMIKLKESVREDEMDTCRILGPARDTMVKINKKYRWNITIKANSREKILQILQRWINVKKSGNNISVNIKFE